MREEKPFWRGSRPKSATGGATATIHRNFTALVRTRFDKKHERRSKDMPTAVGEVYKLGERGSGTKIKGAIQDYEQLRKQCLSRGKLFEDPEFPANSSSLGQLDNNPWKRPGEICKNPHFILDGASRFDLIQGELADCWLISAIANITLDQNIVANIISGDQSYKEGEYAGIFHFRFWQLGKWVDVVIDDRLPVRYNCPRFLHSADNNEFWGSLLEKAYAKLYGSYRALSGGTPSEALEDFTGGLTENLKISDYTANELYKLMKKAYDRSSLMGCAIEGRSNVIEGRTPLGLITTHAYSVTSVSEVTLNNGIKVHLIRLRNPWGNEDEWKGAWSDGSSEWKSISQREKERIGLAFDKDGEFWMCAKDFKQNFSSLDITHLSPEAFKAAEDDGRRRWEVNEFHGKWVRGVSAGGSDVSKTLYANNPQYFITIEDPDPDDDDDETKSTVIVSLMQRSRRSLEQNSTNLFLGFSIYLVENPEQQTKPLEHRFFLYNRAVGNPMAYVNRRAVTHRFLLPPGTYCIVPSTYEANEEREYLLRVFSEKYNDMREHDEEFGEEETEDKEGKCNDEARKGKNQEQIFGEIEANLKSSFSQNCGKDHELDWKQLKELLDNIFQKETKRKGMSKDICRSMVALMDGDKSGKLGYREFKTLLLNVKRWADIFAKYDVDKSGNLDINELKNALAAAGFRISKRILYMLVQRFADSTGKINFDDFLMCAVRLKGMLAIFKEKDRTNKNSATFNLEEWMEVTMYS